MQTSLKEISPPIHSFTMTDRGLKHFRVGRITALAGVGLALLLAIGSMVLLVVMIANPLPLPAPIVPTSVESSMPLTEISELVQIARDAWIRGDADRFASLFAAEGEFIVPGQTYRGRDAIRSVMADFAQSHSQVEITIDRIIESGDRAVVEWRWADTDSSGKRTEAEDAIVVDVQNGLITRWREYIDEISA